MFTYFFIWNYIIDLCEKNRKWTVQVHTCCPSVPLVHILFFLRLAHAITLIQLSTAHVCFFGVLVLEWAMGLEATTWLRLPVAGYCFTIFLKTNLNLSTQQTRHPISDLLSVPYVGNYNVGLCIFLAANMYKQFRSLTQSVHGEMCNYLPKTQLFISTFTLRTKP